MQNHWLNDQPSRNPRRAFYAVMGCIIIGGATLTFINQNGSVADPWLQVGPNPRLPATRQYLVPPMRIAPERSWHLGGSPTVPSDLQIEPLATDLKRPRSVFVLPNGDVLAVEAGGPTPPMLRPKDFVIRAALGAAGDAKPAGNRIILLRPARAGAPAVRTVFLDHLVSPFGVALVGQDLYVANTDAIMRYHYDDGATRISDPGRKLVDLPAGEINHHWTKSLVASPDGTKLYVGIGSNSNVAENGMDAEKDRAAIWEVDRATGAYRIFASGLRNPNGLQFEPVTRALWTVVNERDELGPDLVPDYMTSVRDGGFYGWPYSYYGQHIDPRVKPQRPDLVAKAIPPDYALSSHVAPLGMAFVAGQGLPPAYQGGVFVGEHGSWDRFPMNGYKVIFVPFKDGKPVGAARDVVTGFLTSDNHARGRPVGLAIDKTGALLIADDFGGTVWRVSAKGR
jgi:glucose/arabinose dehydrogenase